MTVLDLPDRGARLKIARRAFLALVEAMLSMLAGAAFAFFCWSIVVGFDALCALAGL